MTPDEARAVLAAAADSAKLQQWEDIDHLLRPVYDANLLTGTDLGDAYYLLGLSYLQTGAWDAAHSFLDEATRTAGDANKKLAADRLAEITRRDAAVDAETAGVEKDNAAAPLAAGDDALARADYDGAYAHYWSVYDGHPDAGTRATAALGIARVFAYRGDLVQGDQYAQYVIGTGRAAAAGAKDLADWIALQRRADGDIADGLTANEYADVWEAGHQAFAAGNIEHARAYFLSALEAPQLASTEHFKAAFNVGLCDQRLGQPDEARKQFEYVLAHGDATAIQKVTARLAAMDSHDAAEELVDEPIF
jgi:tetratricopeptide (TPR) repeat protein